MPQLMLINAIQQKTELVEGAFTLAWNLGSQQGLPLAMRIAAPLDAALYSRLAPSVAARLFEDGEAVLSEVKLFDLARHPLVDPFEGIALLVGDEVAPTIEALRSAMIIIVAPESEAGHQALSAQFPRAIHAQLTFEAPLTELSQSQKEGTEWFDARYDVLVQGHLNPAADAVRLGEGQERSCRYCSRSQPEVTFSNISHALPEQIGNKKLIDLRECDSCNSHFSKLEDNFGKWSLPVRNTARIKGKKNKVPGYKSPDQRMRVDHADGKLKIRVPKGDDRVVMDLANKQLRLTFEQQPYIPMAVFKSFVKMALAVMPEREAQRCKPLKKWILEPVQTADSPFKPLTLFSQFAPGPAPNDQLTYLLLERKDDGVGCPHFLFVLQYSNYCHQIVLPIPAKDGPETRTDLDLRYFPTPWDIPEREKEFGPVRRWQTDLSSPNVLKGETLSKGFCFDSALDVTGKIDPD